MGSIAKQIAWNTLSGYLRLLVSLGVLLLLTPFIINKIGTDGYGLWSLVFSVLSFFELLDFGFASAVIKYVADSKARQDSVGRNEVINTALLVYVLLSTIGLCGIILFSFVFDKLFSIPAAHIRTALLLLWILACRSFMFGLPFSVFRGILFGEQKIFLLNTVSIFCSIGYGCAVWGILSAENGILALGIINLLFGILENVSYLVFSFVYTSGLRISLFKTDYAIFKKMFSFSSAQFISNLSSLVAYNCDLIIVKLFLPLESVSIYAIPLKITSYGYMLIKQFTNVLTPVFADMFALEQKEKIRTLFLRATRYALIPASLIAVMGIVFAEELLVLWVGPEFAKGQYVLILLLVSMWLTAMHLVSGDIMQYCGYHHMLALFSLIAIFAHLAVSFSLIHPLGLAGVASGALAAAFVGYATDLRKVCEIYEVKRLTFIRSIAELHLLPVVSQAAVLLVLKGVVPIFNLWILALVNLPGIGAYFLVLWFFCLDEGDKKGIAGILRKAPKPPAKAEHASPENIE